MPFIKPFLRYFDFSGRSGRAEFWQYMALMIIVSMVLGLLEMGSAIEAAQAGVISTPVWSSVFGLLTFIPSIAVTFRRLHDRNKSGWLYGYLLIAIFPVFFIYGMYERLPAIWPLAVAVSIAMILYTLYLIYELAQPGDYYENSFGEPDSETLEVPHVLGGTPQYQPAEVQSVIAPEASPIDPPQSLDVFSQIERFAALHSTGALTDEEFSAQKARLLRML